MDWVEYVEYVEHVEYVEYVEYVELCINIGWRRVESGEEVNRSGVVCSLCSLCSLCSFCRAFVPIHATSDKVD